MLPATTGQQRKVDATNKLEEVVVAKSEGGGGGGNKPGKNTFIVGVNNKM